MALERLHKYLARCGIASRRKAEELILQGQVKVNGIVVNELGSKIDPEQDTVTIKGKKVNEKEKYTYIKLYKPEGYVTTVKDQFNRKTVMDLINIKERIFPIGRLDYNTSGLLLLTDDGNLANKLMHPKYRIYKTYEAEISGRVSKDSLDLLRSGVIIDGYKTAPARVKILKEFQNTSIVQISIHEGKNRQVRKMFETVGHKVIKLKRISFGNIDLSNMKPGEWKYLTHHEIKYLKE
jgi:pseudouridine synthase